MNIDKLKAAVGPWAEALGILVQLYLYGAHQNGSAGKDTPVDIALEILDDMDWPKQEELWKAKGAGWTQELSQKIGQKVNLALFQGTKTQPLMDAIQKGSTIFFP